MIINLIMAASLNGVIGIDGKLPWHIPEDMQHFREHTNRQFVVMGRKTYDSLPAAVRPLPNRHNIVISRSFFENVPDDAVVFMDGSVAYEGVNYFPSVDAVLTTFHEGQVPVIWVIGGREIYDAFLPYADNLYITRVFKIIRGENLVLAPEFSLGDWAAISSSGEKTHIVYGDDPEHPGKKREVDRIKFEFVKYRSNHRR